MESESTCPICHHLKQSELPAGLEADRFLGPRLDTMIEFLKHQNHLSYERIVNALREIYGLKISGGGILAINVRAGNLASAEAAETREAVISSLVVQSDETSARVKGRNYWHWVYFSGSGVNHQNASRRNAEVIRDLMEQLIADVWGSYCIREQMKAEVKDFQLCLQHKLRDTKRILERLAGSVWAT